MQERHSFALTRRGVLGAAAVIGTSVATSGVLAGAAQAAPAGEAPPALRGGHYVPNRAPLAPVPFQKLPPGAVRARGWLAGQLALQVDGMGGRYDEVSHFLAYDNCGWVDPAKGGWEELPYWLRGLGDLGYVTGDQRILEKAKRWIDGILATQAPDGWFGPTALRTSLEGGPDFWPGMPLLAALRSWQEYSGDERILPFILRFLRFQHDQAPEIYGRSWGSFRWGDNMDTAYWAYNRTGEAWLLELVETMHEHSADYTNGLPTLHNVNLAQGFREPLQFGLLADAPSYADATYRNYAEIMRRWGQFPGGGFAGDENSRPGYGDPRQGFETCGIVEFMHSFEMLTRFTADISWADRCEELAFNMLPAAFDPQQRAIHYITSANCTQLDDEVKHGQFQNAFAMLAYKTGIDQYRCCPHNYGMGWPYFTEELWLATTDNGLAAAMYAPSDVTARVGPGTGTQIRVETDTDYPFGETITLRVRTSAPVSFPLYLRIPGWARDASLRVPGQRTRRPAAGSWVKVQRSWRDRDEVVLHLPMKVSLRHWTANADSVSVDRGPLTYSLDIAEKFSRIGGTDQWPEYAVQAGSAWNYGLLADRHVTVDATGLKAGVNPFTKEGTPVRLRATGRAIAEWVADGEAVVGVLQQSPAAGSGPLKSLSLIPMGAARLRITSFPATLAGDGGTRWDPQWAITASHINGSDSYEAIHDGRKPAGSGDDGIARFTFWDRRGTSEWIEIDLREPQLVTTMSVYWFDDTGRGQCRVPAAWRLAWHDESAWRPVSNPTGFATMRDRFNTVRFDKITTQRLRIDVDLQATFSGGVLELNIG